MKYRLSKATLISAGIGVLVIFSLAKSAEIFKKRSARETVPESSFLIEGSGSSWMEDYYQDNQEVKELISACAKEL